MPFVRSLLLAAVSTFVAVVAAEILLRAFPDLTPESVALRRHWNALRAMPTLSQPDPYMGFRYPSRESRTVDRGETRFTFHTDEHGFRNEVGWPDTAEVVVVGDSQVFGWGVADDEVWTRKLDLSLPDLDVLNLGLPGMSPTQYTRVLEVHGLGRHPRVVLYTLFPGNDGQDESLFIAWESAGSPGNYDEWRFFGGPPPKRGLLDRIKEESALVTLVRTARRGVAGSGETLTLANRERIRIAPGLYASAGDRLRPGDPAFEGIHASVARAHALADSVGAEFIVMLIPTKEEVYLPTEDERFPSLIEAVTPTLDARGYRLLDVTPALRARSREALFFEVDGHPNARGSAVIADTTRAHLLSSGALTGGSAEPAPGEGAEPEPVHGEREDAGRAHGES